MLNSLRYAGASAVLRGLACIAVIPVAMTAMSVVGLVDPDWATAPATPKTLIAMVLASLAIVIALPADRILGYVLPTIRRGRQ